MMRKIKVTEKITSIAIMLFLMLCIFAQCLTNASAWGNGSGSNSTYPYYGIHDIIADIAYKTLKNYNSTYVQYITNWYMQNSSDFENSFNAGSSSPSAHDNYLAYTDDPDSSIQDWDNHLYYVHVGSSKGAPGRVAQLYNYLVSNLTWYIKNGTQKWCKEEHYAAYYAGILSHYLVDMTQYGHTDHTEKDHSHPSYDPEGTTYHDYYESANWGTQGLSAIISALNAQSYTISQISDAYNLTVNLAKWVNAHNGTTASFKDTDGSNYTLGSTYVYMLTRFVSQYDAGTTYNGMRGYDTVLWNLTVQHLRAAVENFTSVLYSAYKQALQNAGNTTTPVISNVAVSGITASGATINWTTNVASSSIVEYGTTTSYGRNATGASGVTAHSVTLSGLSASTTYHFRVKSANTAGNTATSSDYTFTTSANASDVVSLTDGVAKTGSISAAKDAKNYSLVVPAGKTQLKVELTGPSGTDFDLYAKLGAKPTTSAYDYRSIGSTSNETITVTNPSAGTWYFMVYSYSGSGTFTIKATTSTSQTNVTQLTDGVATTGSLSGTGNGKYYSITIPSGKAQLKVELTGPSGADFDLYVKLGSTPTTSTYNYSGTTSSASETISIANPAAGTWYIYVYSYSGSGNFTIKASTSTTTDSGQLSDGVAKTGSLSDTGQKAYFYITIPSGKSQFKIELTGPSGTDFDLYVKLGSTPSTSSYDYRSIGSTSTETITINSPSAGTWYIMVYSHSGSGSFTIKASTSS